MKVLSMILSMAQIVLNTGVLIYLVRRKNKDE